MTATISLCWCAASILPPSKAAETVSWFSDPVRTWRGFCVPGLYGMPAIMRHSMDDRQRKMLLSK